MRMMLVAGLKGRECCGLVEMVGPGRELTKPFRKLILERVNSSSYGECLLSNSYFRLLVVYVKRSFSGL